MINRKVTLALSSHRPEMIPVLTDWMGRHQTIILEEPRTVGFNRMLKGRLDIEDYLMPLDLEYPAFSRRLYRLLRKLSIEGKTIIQSEPFLEALIGIHDAFAAGGRPDEIDKNSIQYPVYLAERNATRALLAYYQSALSAPFGKVVDAVCRFARMDAARFRLRDGLRAQEINRLLRRYSSVYIEAGEMHYPLWQQMNRLSGSRPKVRLIFLAEEMVPDLRLRRYLYGPGDRLTLLYSFHRNTKQNDRHTLLAARSLIHSKIVQKEEMADDATELPHLRDDLRCNRMVCQLSWTDCRYLFDKIRQAETRQANELVVDYIKSLKGIKTEHETYTI